MAKRASSKTGKTSKALQIHNQAVLVNNINGEIDIFGGNRTNARYRDLQKILATTSIKVQELKAKTRKQHNRDYCEDIQGKIQQCMQRLESRASFNGKKDFSPFVTEKLALPEPTLNENTEEENFASAWRLVELDEECDRLQRDLEDYVDMSDVKQLSYLEKQIRLLYRQLELVSVRNYTPLGDKKLAIGKRLIKHNNQIRKMKRNIKRRSKSYVNLDDHVLTVEDQLEELEAAVSSFDGTKRDHSYSELHHNLEWQKIILHRVSNDSETKHRCSLLIDKVNALMWGLQQKAESNENQVQTINIGVLQQVENFRDLWNNLDRNLPESIEYRKVIKVFENVSEEIDDMIIKLRFFLNFQNDTNDTRIYQEGGEQNHTDSQKLEIETGANRSQFLNDLNTDQPRELYGTLQSQTNSDSPLQYDLTDYEQLETITEEDEYQNNSTDWQVLSKQSGLPTVQDITDQVQTLQYQLDNYCGFYQDPTYNKIESGLNTCYDTLNDIECLDQNRKTRTQENIKSYLRILKTKSIHPDYNENTHLLENVANDIDTVKSEIDQFQKPYRELKRSIEEIINVINETGDENNNCSIMKRQYMEEASNLLNYLDEKSMTSKLPRDKDESSIISDPLQDLTIVEGKIANIKVAISELNASSSQDKPYQDISRTIKSCVSEIDEIDAGNVAFVREQKRKLSKELRNCEILLSNKFDELGRHDLNNIRQILQKLSDAEVQINSFSGCKGDSAYSSLDELLVTLMVQLNNAETHSDEGLETEKRKGIQAILRNIRILSKKAESYVGND